MPGDRVGCPYDIFLHAGHCTHEGLEREGSLQSQEHVVAVQSGVCGGVSLEVEAGHQ